MTIKQILNYSIYSSDTITVTLFHFLMVVIILLGTKIALGITRRLIKRQIKKSTVEQSKIWSAFQILKYIIWIVAIAFCLDTLSIKITFIVASSAALLVGIGLGLQNIFNDLISGLFILFEGNIKLDDYVEVNGVVGKIDQIGARTSSIMTLDNIQIIIPNSKFIADNIINWSNASKETRFYVEVGVAYGSDVDLVTKTLIECAKAHPSILKKPEPTVYFLDFADSSLNFRLMFWLEETSLFMQIRSDLRYSIDSAFRQRGIEIPFPQRDVHLKSKKY